MNGLEAAIKNALARSDRSSAEVRARIYQSSREALEAGLRKQNIEDPDVVAGHRQRLEQLIRLIELQERERLLSLVAEHVKKTTPPTPAPEKGPTVGGVLRREPAFSDEDDPSGDDSLVAPEPSSPSKSAHAPAPEIAVDRGADNLVARRDKPVAATQAAGPLKPAAGQRAEPRLGADDDFTARDDDDLGGAYDLTNSTRGDDNIVFKADPIVVHKKRRGFFARLMIIFTLLAFVALAGAWIYTSGVLISAEERDQSVPNPPVEIQEEDFNGQENEGASQAPAPVPDQQLSGGFSADWLEIFNAEKNLGAVAAGSMVSIENIELPAGKAIRVNARSPSQAGDLRFDVPVDVMRALTGRSATIAVTLQSSTDLPAQVAVDCDFKSLGHCSRHRFTAMPERSDFLIDAKFTDAIVANAAGQITVNADISGEERAINLYSVRILPSN